MPGTGMTIDLVHNPVGTELPGSQSALEDDYRTELRERHGVSFNRLLTITNMPINRFAAGLRSAGRYDEYVAGLRDVCNPAAASAVMCRSMVSVALDGSLHDCDFNQALGIAISTRATHRCVRCRRTRGALDSLP